MIDAIKIGPIRYTVKMVDDLHRIDGDGRKQWLDGQITYSDTLINVAKDQSDDMKIAVMWHEALHGVLHQAGHGNHDEALIIALGYGIIQLIRDNPELVDLTLNGDQQSSPAESE